MRLKIIYQKILDDRNIYYSVFELKLSHKAIGIVTFINREEEQFPDLGFQYIEDSKKETETLCYYSYKNDEKNVARYFSFAKALKLGPAPEGNLAIPVFSHGSMEAELNTPE